MTLTLRERLLYRLHEALGMHHFRLRRARGRNRGWVARCSCGVLLKRRTRIRRPR